MLLRRRGAHHKVVQRIIPRLGSGDAEGALQRIEGEGSVDVRTSEGNTASGNSLVYLAKTEKATLVGDVSVSDGKSTMQGGRAEVDFVSGNSRLLSDEKNGRVRGVLITK